MAKYVDGFVIPVPIEKLEEYKRLAEQAGAIWREHGALEYHECVGDDLDIEDLVSFRNVAQARAGETVVFSWILFESREHRDQVNAAVMADPRTADMVEPGSEPFDMKRMVVGGFRTLVDL